VLPIFSDWQSALTAKVNGVFEGTVLGTGSH
jgi:hypothetical protein